MVDKEVNEEKVNEEKVIEVEEDAGKGTGETVKERKKILKTNVLIRLKNKSFMTHT